MGIAAGIVKALLVVGGFDVDRGAKTELINIYIDIKEDSLGREKVKVTELAYLSSGIKAMRNFFSTC